MWISNNETKERKKKEKRSTYINNMFICIILKNTRIVKERNVKDKTSQKVGAQRRDNVKKENK